MPRLKQDAVLGLVFFGGLALLLVATALLSNFSLTPREELEVRFPNAQNLSIGDPVFVLGTRFGSVQTVEYVAGAGANRIKVVLVLDRELTLYKDYRISIADSSFLGGKMIMIDPGSSDQGIFDPTSQRVVGKSPTPPLEALGEMFAGENNKESLESLLSGLASLVENTRQGQGTIGKLFTETKLYDEATAFVEDLRTLVRDAREGRGTLGQLIANDQLYRDAEAFFSYARDIGRRVAEGDGTIARLLNDKSLADDLRAAAGDVRAVTENLRQAQGLLGRAISDPELGREFERIVRNVGEASEAINRGEGVLPALLHDGELRTGIDRIVADVGSITRGLVEGRGTLGRLLQDDRLINDFEKVVRQVSRGIEDAREAAPISTFFSLFAGSFN